jgi:hypothetical protein
MLGWVPVNRWPLRTSEVVVSAFQGTLREWVMSPIGAFKWRRSVKSDVVRPFPGNRPAMARESTGEDEDREETPQQTPRNDWEI